MPWREYNSAVDTLRFVSNNGGSVSNPYIEKSTSYVSAVCVPVPVLGVTISIVPVGVNPRLASTAGSMDVWEAPVSTNARMAWGVGMA